LLYLGEFVPARAHLEQGIALDTSQQYRNHAFLYGQDPGMGCRIFAALILWVLGYPDQALQWSHEALTLPRELSHPFSLSYALTRSARLYEFRGKWQTGQERAEELIALAREQGFAQALAIGLVQRGSVLAAQGHAQEGITQTCPGSLAPAARGESHKNIISRASYISMLLQI
jgi:tetratricopeptide (TPR) repeat protein